MERDQATELVHNLLRGMTSKKASDLFITTGFPPAFKLDGKIVAVSNQVLNAQHTQELARSIMNDRQAAEFEATHECNFAISPPGIGRFRVNVFQQQQRVGMVLRTITTKTERCGDDPTRSGSGGGRYRLRKIHFPGRDAGSPQQEFAGAYHHD
jgi:twitching motility protein PilU